MASPFLSLNILLFVSFYVDRADWFIFIPFDGFFFFFFFLFVRDAKHYAWNKLLLSQHHPSPSLPLRQIEEKKNLFFSSFFFCTDFVWLVCELLTDLKQCWWNVSHLQISMSLTKVLLYGLKPCDMIINSKDNENEQSLSNKSTTKDQKKETDFLNIDIKPLVTPTSSVSGQRKSNIKCFLFLFFCSVENFNEQQ